MIDRFMEKVEIVPWSGCWIWMALVNHGGYGLFRDANSKMVSAHRESYRLFRGALPDDMYVCHTCDVPECVNPAHLFLGTNSDNQKDSWRKGRHGRVPNSGFKTGEKNHNAKVTPEIVRFIRDRMDIYDAEMARLVGINKTTIGHIRKGRTWQHV